MTGQRIAFVPPNQEESEACLFFFFHICILSNLFSPDALANHSGMPPSPDIAITLIPINIAMSAHIVTKYAICLEMIARGNRGGGLLLLLFKD